MNLFELNTEIRNSRHPSGLKMSKVLDWVKSIPTTQKNDMTQILRHYAIKPLIDRGLSPSDLSRIINNTPDKTCRSLYLKCWHMVNTPVVYEDDFSFGGYYLNSLLLLCVIHREYAKITYVTKTDFDIYKKYNTVICEESKIFKRNDYGHLSDKMRSKWRIMEFIKIK